MELKGHSMRTSSSSRASELDLCAAVDRIAAVLPAIARLTILDAVDAESDRLRVMEQPHLAPLVEPAALWRLRQTGGDLAA